MSEPFHKLLKDFKLNEWMEAADGCEYCGAKYEVRVTDLWSANFGDVEYRIKHKPDCPEKFMDEDEEEPAWDNAGWEFMEKPIIFRGNQYYPLKSKANIGPCLECGKLVIGVPLILFIDDCRKGELDFCWDCAKRLGILELKRKVKSE